ncbi:hypothetical protein [Bathymodiolus platifrons methanotrophic gill symbiont]|uniref:hypothetical protein n=1 Tax=Bathymodiolus platifrons methanotrophic gill symbiont TaxID=113268 RepID=UPI001C8EE785|nr:hypothetical protein [Bathymodiolus platifrons methanotrophic gill symbiont]
MATSNGSTAIRDKILASLARYRALRIGKFPCAFWRLSSRPGLTANDWTAFRNAFYFVSTYASATIPTKQRPYAFWGLPALAFALHGWQRLRQ